MEIVEPVAEILGQRGGGGDGFSGFGVGEAQFGGVQHLAGDFGEIGAAGAEVLAIAEDGVADVVEMDADLVRAPGLDGDGDVGAARGLGLRGDLAHMADGGEMVDVQADVHLGFGQVAGDEGVVELADAAFLELRDERETRLLGLGEEDAAGGVFVEAMHGAQGGQAELVAQAGLEGFLAVGEQARGFVGDEEERIVEQDADRGVGLPGGAEGVGEDFDDVAVLEQMLGHPDAAAIDEDHAFVEQGFGGAAGEGQMFGEMIEQLGAVAADGRQSAMMSKTCSS